MCLEVDLQPIKASDDILRMFIFPNPQPEKPSTLNSKPSALIYGCALPYSKRDRHSQLSTRGLHYATSPAPSI